MAKNPAFGKWTEEQTNWSSVDTEFIKNTLEGESIPTSYEELLKDHEVKLLQ